jgi:hypothetical protein
MATVSGELLFVHCTRQLPATLERLRQMMAINSFTGNAGVLWDFVPTLDGAGPCGQNSHCPEQNLEEGKEQESVDADSFVPKAVLNATALLRLLSV